ncbi:hypothetical protein AVEN_255897-1 [Araneus ventricosus]|uniref:Uncharacterized protein n=1 Tax=Araneus ventricosus TaxID=182803 RepID=A0A4Y2DDH9_ARAVE|nr:hypothetical protein AVEN_255897-1 [Araneus ventricosus]
MPVILDNESEEGDSPAPIDMVDEQLECEDIEFVKAAIHFTDKLDILEREKEKAIKINGNQACGSWNSVWTVWKTLEFKVSHQRDPGG